MTMHSPDPMTPTIAPRALRDVLGRYATGVAVVTTCDAVGGPVGMTINSFASVSLDPPLVLWSIGLEAASRRWFGGHGAWTVNVLPEGAEALALHFARPSDDRFAGVAWRPGWHGVPVLAEAVAVLECRSERLIEAGDHEILIGRVLSAEATDAAPLLFHRGRFGAMAV